MSEQTQTLPPYDPDEAVRQWARVPLAELGYLTVEQVRVLSNQQRAALVHQIGTAHFDTNTWRNRDGQLVNFMMIGQVAGKRVFDFGCGFGQDAILFALNRANVFIGDLNLGIVQLAHEHAALFQLILQPVPIGPRAPFFVLQEPIN